MQKRKALGDTLTGGTRDVNPQYMHGTLTLSAANTATTVTVGTPIVRVGNGANQGKAVIMEVLKVFADLPVIDLDNAAATVRNITLAFTTVDPSTTAVQFDNSRCFAWLQRQVRNAFTAAGTGQLDVDESPAVFDCTDGAGHGVLIATDNIYVQGITSNQTAASAFRWKILYRFKEVSLVEYIGIVQSQQ